MDQSYYNSKCFPLSQLKAKLKNDFAPFFNIEKKQLVKKDKKNRLQITLTNRNGDRKNISLLLSVEYAKPGQEEKNKYFINSMSYDNAVASHKKMASMQNDLDSELFESPLNELDD